METVRRACVTTPPPEPLGAYLSGPTEGCEPTWAGCLSLDSGVALEAYLRRIQAWSDEAWIQCGPSEEHGTDKGTP